MLDKILYEGKVKLFFQDEPLNLWVWKGGLEIKDSVVSLLKSLDQDFLKALEATCREMAEAVCMALGAEDHSKDFDILSMIHWSSVNVGRSFRHPNPALNLGWNIEGWTPDDWGFDDGFVINFEGLKVVGWYTKNIDIEDLRHDLNI